ncbi:MAG: lipopolysaccharide biosynthesis protein [Deltaproteobacteria bacterium]|nr:lipopolysaccharide biosynthesis protein [Deltaproteobacteria bacterium]
MLFAKVYFIGTGLVQQALLPKAIGLADYGALSRVLAVSNVFNNVVVSSSTQGVSRMVAAAGAAEREALRATLHVHGVIALLAGVLLAGVAPFVVHFQCAAEILMPLFVMTGVLTIYGVYAPLVGYLNGRRQFARQASLDVVAATLRTGGLLGLGYVFTKSGQEIAAQLHTSPGLLGATMGAVLAALGVFLLAVRWTGFGKSWSGARPEGVPTAKAYVGLILPVMVAQLFTNGLMQADIIMLGRYLSLASPSVDQCAQAATSSTTAANAANEWVAVYRACQLFAFLPYQMLFSVTQVLFPMLAKAKAEEGDARVAELVARGCRIGAIVGGMLVCVVLAMPGSLIKFAYGAEVALRGASTLRVLALGQAAFAMLGLATTILVSLGKERPAMVLTAVALFLLVGSCAVMIPGASFGTAQLHAAATATCSALVLALVVGIFVVRRSAGAFVPLKTALRVGGCIAGAFAVGAVMPMFSKLLTPVVATGVVLTYFGALVVTREIGKEDLSLVLSIAARRSKR